MTDEPDTSEAAKAFSQLGASKGGKARANVLTPEERQEIARNAVRARWLKAGKLKQELKQELVNSEPEASDSPPPIPFSMFRGMLRIGDVELECHVLSDGRRVFTQGEVVRVLTGGTESSNLARYLWLTHW